MGRRVQGDGPGKIFGLLQFLRRDGVEGALRSDLLQIGRSLDELGRSLSWPDLAAFIDHADPHTAIARITDPLRVYTSPEIETNLWIVDRLREVEWQLAGRPEGFDHIPSITLLRRAAEGALTSNEDQAPPPAPIDIRAELARRAVQHHEDPTVDPAPTRVTGAHVEQAAWIRDQLAERRAANQ